MARRIWSKNHILKYAPLPLAKHDTFRKTWSEKEIYDVLGLDADKELSGKRRMWTQEEIESFGDKLYQTLISEKKGELNRYYNNLSTENKALVKNIIDDAKAEIETADWREYDNIVNNAIEEANALIALENKRRSSISALENYYNNLNKHWKKVLVEDIVNEGIDDIEEATTINQIDTIKNDTINNSNSLIIDKDSSLSTPFDKLILENYLGDGEYKLHERGGLTIDYNIFSGIYNVDGAIEGFYVYELFNIEQNNEYTLSFLPVSGTFTGVNFSFSIASPTIYPLHISDGNVEHQTSFTTTTQETFRITADNNRVFNNYKFKLELEKGD